MRLGLGEASTAGLKWNTTPTVKVCLFIFKLKYRIIGHPFLLVSIVRQQAGQVSYRVVPPPLHYDQCCKWPPWAWRQLNWRSRQYSLRLTRLHYLDGPPGTVSAAGPAVSPSAVHSYVAVTLLVSLNVCSLWGGCRSSSNVVTVVTVNLARPCGNLSPNLQGQT